MNNRSCDRGGALQADTVGFEPDALGFERIDHAAQRPVLRRQYSVRRAFPCAQTVAMNPGARGELVLAEMSEDTRSTNHRARDFR